MRRTCKEHDESLRLAGLTRQAVRLSRAKVLLAPATMTSPLPPASKASHCFIASKARLRCFLPSCIVAWYGRRPARTRRWLPWVTCCARTGVSACADLGASGSDAGRGQRFHIRHAVRAVLSRARAAQANLGPDQPLRGCMDTGTARSALVRCRPTQVVSRRWPTPRIFGALNWAVQWFNPRGSLPLDDSTEQAIGLITGQP